DRTALVAGEARRTYRQLDQRANQVAHHFLAAGIRPGEHVGILAWNRAEWVELMLGILKLRAVPININYRYVEDELRYVFSNADLAAVAYAPELADRVDAVRADVPTLRHALVIDGA